jgi:MATE family multidrug resistance protein
MHMADKENIINQSTGLISHSVAMLRLGLPIVASMAALIGLSVTDTIMAGLASTTDLAALAIGSNFYFVAVMTCIGMQSVVAPRVAWHLGAGHKNRLTNELWQSMWVGLGVGCTLAVILYFGISLLPLLKLTAEVQRIAEIYLLLVTVMLPFVAVNLALRNSLDGLELPHYNMVINLTVFVLNILLNYVLVFGKFGMPKLGAVGCGIATCLVTIMQTLATLLLFKYSARLKPFQLWHRIIWPEFAHIKRLLWLGLPAAGAITLEECFFASTTVLVAPMGSVPLATHQVVLNIALIALVFPIAMGQAGAIIIGRSLGEQRPQLAYQQSYALLVTLLAMMCICSVVLFLSRSSIISFYSKDEALLLLGASLLAIVAVQLLVDGLQIGVNIALKGYQDTMVPALLQIFCYWVVGFPLAWCLTKTDWFGGPLGVEGVWYALLFGLTLAAVAGVARLIIVGRQFAAGARVLPEQVEAESAVLTG